MKSGATEMIEGPEAFERFRAALKAVLSVSKSEIVKQERKEAQRKNKKPASPKG
jgi:hypothetical protein